MIDTAVLSQVVGVAGLAMCGDVGRRRAGCEVEKAYATRDEAGVLDVTAPDCTINTLLDEIGAPLAAGE